MPDVREKLSELIAIGGFLIRSADAERCVDYLIANGVTIIPDKPEKPPTDLRGKCGGCDYAVPVPAFGSTYAYVKCTHPEHLARYKKSRFKSGIRQRTTKACKKYLQKEGL